MQTADYRPDTKSVQTRYKMQTALHGVKKVGKEIKEGRRLRVKLFLHPDTHLMFKSERILISAYYVCN